MAADSGEASVLTKAMTIDDPEHGITRASVVAADTSGLPAGKYYYEVSRIDTGFNQVLAWGDAHLRARIT
jgi:hypothetical protein